MKLLLDEMWPPNAAQQLRDRGHDVVAVAERPDLRGQPDRIVFAVAQAEARAVVTENVVDYIPLAREAVQAASHCGLVLTSNRTFPRHDANAVGRLVRALDSLLASAVELVGVEYWLQDG